jgi:hypothetical protein
MICCNVASAACTAVLLCFMQLLHLAQLASHARSDAGALSLCCPQVCALLVAFLWQGWASGRGYNVSATHSISE